MKSMAIMAVLAGSLLSLAFSCVQNGPVGVNPPGGDGTVEKPQVPPAATCFRDTDCVLMDEGYCRCNVGGESIAVHKDQAESYNESLKKYRDAQPLRACPQSYNCGRQKARCVNRTCRAVNADNDYYDSRQQ